MTQVTTVMVRTMRLTMRYIRIRYASQSTLIALVIPDISCQFSCSLPEVYCACMTRKPDSNPPLFDTFGDLLKYLRRRAQLTQRELGIAVGYSEAHISRIEKNQRAVDSATIAALFLPALELSSDSELARRMFELASRDRGQENVVAEPTGIPSNLPMQFTSFVGRESEGREVAERLRGLARARLLTLCGA